MLLLVFSLQDQLASILLTLGVPRVAEGRAHPLVSHTPAVGAAQSTIAHRQHAVNPRIRITHLPNRGGIGPALMHACLP